MLKKTPTPLFILGFPRSGTTAMLKALQIINRFKYPKREIEIEGHFTYFFSEILKRIKSGQINKASVLDDKQYFELFKRKLSFFLNDYWEKISDAHDDDFWIEKTPDLRQVQSIPEYVDLFERAKYIFMYRDPYSCIASNLQTWSLDEKMLCDIAQRWVDTMKEWRIQKQLIAGNYLEVYQNRLRASPQNVINELGVFLSLSESEKNRIIDYIKCNEINSSKNKKGYILSKEQHSKIFEIVSAEMKYWEGKILY